jgi:mycothiol synthase
VNDVVLVEAGEADLAAACAIAGQSFDLDDEDASDLPRYVWDEEPGTSRIRLLAREDGDPVGLLIGTVQGATAFLDLIAVVPGARNRGIAKRLLTEWEGRAAAAGATTFKAGENVLGYAWAGVDIRYTPALCLLIRAGYERTQIVYNMDLPLDGFAGPSPAQLERLSVAGIEVRRGEPGDRDALADHVRRLWSDVWLRETLIAIDRPRPPIFLALRDGAVIGFAAHAVYRPSLYGPIATDPAEQGHGVGNALSGLALADMAAGGVKTAQIGWIAETAIPFYSRTAGARLGRCFWMLAKPAPGAPAA